MNKPTEVIHVVVSCTNRKTVTPSDHLKVRTLPGRSTEKRVGTWIARLALSQDPAIPARDLYCGEHWTVAKSLTAVASQVRRSVQVWVVSAGYGLIPVDAYVHSYSATFSPGHLDTVSSQESQAGWWHTLSQWSGPAEGAPRSLSELSIQAGAAPILIALSPPYLRACAPDLLSALESANCEQISIVSAGERTGRFEGAQLPSDARLQHVLGGSRQALNVRIALHLVANVTGPMDRKRLADALAELLDRQPPVPEYNRKPVPDDKVRQFISDQLDQNDRLSHSRLLRMFRESGRACEQSRFRLVYESVRVAR